MKVRTLAITLIVSGCSLVATPVFANSRLDAAYNAALESCNRNSDPTSRGRCQLNAESAYRRERFWRGLTQRQRNLATQIGQIYNNHLKRTRQALPVTNGTVNQVMRIIGANPNEASFVINRMQANYQAIIATTEAQIGVDATLDSLPRILQP